VKLFLMWLAAALWFAACAYLSVTYFQEGLGSELGFFERPKSLLTGIGCLTVAALPAVGAGLIHRYHRRRRRGRLLKEKDKIERQLRRLDEKEGRGRPAAAPSATEAAERL
jgi:hypothetical protein